MSTTPLMEPFDNTPHMKIQKTGHRWMAWEAWVAVGPMRYAGEWGTYARTRKGAERKARRLLRRYERTRRPAPIEIPRDAARALLHETEESSK